MAVGRAGLTAAPCTAASAAIRRSRTAGSKVASCWAATAATAATAPTPAHGGRGGNWIYAPSEETGPLSAPNWPWWDGWEWAFYDSVTGLPSTDATTPFTNVYREYWRYSGCGGAVYCEFESSPKFLNCTFENNFSNGGVSGLGGGPNDNARTPPLPQNIENFGGAFYAAYDCNPELLNCTFSRCWSDKQFDPNSGPDPNNIPDPNLGTFLRPEDYYFSYGGAIAFEQNCAPKLVQCTITDCNAALGGAIYWSSRTWR